MFYNKCHQTRDIYVMHFKDCSRRATDNTPDEALECSHKERII